MEESAVVENGHIEVKAAPAAEPAKITREEQLTLENMGLKVENLRLQQERLKQDFAAAQRMLLDLQKEATAYAAMLREKYGAGALATAAPS